MRLASDVQIAGLEDHPVLTGLLTGRDLLAGVGEVAVAVAVDVQGVAVPDDPDAVAGLRPDDQQGVARGA